MEDKKVQELAQAFAAEKAALEKKLADAEALAAQAKAEKEKAEAALRTSAMDAEIDKFFDEEAKGRLTPKAEAHLKRVMKAVSGGVEYEFAEEGKIVKATALADLKAFVKTLPVIYKQGEQATAGAADGGALFQTLAEMGGTTDKERIAAEWTETLSPNQILAKMKAREQNETWQLNDELFRESLARLEAWIEANIESPEKEELVAWRFLLYVTHWGRVGH